VAALPAGLFAQATIARTLNASEAKDHVGETATVCGKVASTKFAAASRSQPTFLNLDKPYPNNVFTVLIWGADRQKFGQPEEKYRDKEVCVTGSIAIYRGVAEIVAKEPTQIKLQQR
jgi:micrococcal nuclease